MTPQDLKKLESMLWQAADTFRASIGIKPSVYSFPILGLIFLKFVENKYYLFEKEIFEDYESRKNTRTEKTLEEISIEKCGFYVPEKARYNYLLNLPEKEDLAQAIKDAMLLIEKYKKELADTLPKEEYFSLNRRETPDRRKVIDNKLLKDILKNFNNIPQTLTGDILGKIYEYFLGKFALQEGQDGGKFYTPQSVVKLMVEIIEPHDGAVFDPACGSGGMFVQSLEFVRRRSQKDDNYQLYVYGQEYDPETVNLAKMNIAVNGLRGDIRYANSYYDDCFSSFEKFDFVLANPPFNVDDVNLARVEGDKRFNTYGIPRNKTDAKAKDKGNVTVPNANYLWINLFATSLKAGTGRAALVMANSASDARHSEADIRETLIEKNLIYCMLTLPSNMFYTVTLPATLWFFDKGKTDDNILFIDTRNIFTQIDRSHREFSEEQIQNIAIISRLHKGDRSAFISLIHGYFQNGFDALLENKPKLAEVAHKVASFLKANGVTDSPDFSQVLKEVDTLLSAYNEYMKGIDCAVIEKANTSQIALASTIAPFFAKLHELLKDVDKKVRHIEKEQSRSKNLKALKSELEELHTDVKATEYFFGHIAWLHERFPEAKYEDVTGLCKLASRDDVKEQDYSLNPGRYVGVVIEEDGKTEEEFIEEMIALQEELEKLNAEAHDLEDIIAHNIRRITGEE